MSAEKNSTVQLEQDTAEGLAGKGQIGRKIISRKEAKRLGIKRYFTGKPCKHGHVAERQVSGGQCIPCKVGRTNEYRKNNPDLVKSQAAKYRANRVQKNRDYAVDRYWKNPEVYREKARLRRASDVDMYRKRERAWYASNAESIRTKKRGLRLKNKEKYAASVKRWRKKNPANGEVRNILLRAESNWKGGREAAEKTLGYTYEQLRQRIEFNFKDGMSWDNRSEWHIDHKKPVSAFIKQGITDPKIINALSNLQPLWAHENLTKSTRYETRKLR